MKSIILCVVLTLHIVVGQIGKIKTIHIHILFVNLTKKVQFHIKFIPCINLNLYYILM